MRSLQACLGQLLDIDPDTIPDFGTNWFKPFVDWCEEQDIGFIWFGTSARSCFLYNIPVIGVYGNELHAVICKVSFIEQDGKWAWKADVTHNPDETIELGEPKGLLYVNQNL